MIPGEIYPSQRIRKTGYNFLSLSNRITFVSKNYFLFLPILYVPNTPCPQNVSLADYLEASCGQWAHTSFARSLSDPAEVPSHKRWRSISISFVWAFCEKGGSLSTPLSPSLVLALVAVSVEVLSEEVLQGRETFERKGNQCKILVRLCESTVIK